MRHFGFVGSIAEKIVAAVCEQASQGMSVCGVRTEIADGASGESEARDDNQQEVSTEYGLLKERRSASGREEEAVGE